MAWKSAPAWRPCRYDDRGLTARTSTPSTATAKSTSSGPATVPPTGARERRVRALSTSGRGRSTAGGHTNSVPRLSPLVIGVPTTSRAASSTTGTMAGAARTPGRTAVRTRPTMAGNGNTQRVLQATASASPAASSTSSTPGARKAPKTITGPASSTRRELRGPTTAQAVNAAPRAKNAGKPSPNTIRSTATGSVPLSSRRPTSRKAKVAPTSPRR